jgi:hypothetical protein
VLVEAGYIVANVSPDLNIEGLPSGAGGAPGRRRGSTRRRSPYAV